MINISSEVVTKAVTDLVTSQMAQAVAGTIVGLAIVASTREAVAAIGPQISRAWRRLRTDPPIIEGTAQPAA